ncbi:PREDICTED: probable RNA-binding [Prunus dulcis]|uniref:PREDICTED: probable RNA-binding n=1 Tax=Prunus dulcis TaxID=3755 RepID=A0A5E4ES86_PRUDU|nr:PREDICTED: probable RNA-binding [Prunus dulcis]
MKGGRKNLKRAVEEESLTIKDGHSIMQVLSLRGSNLIEIMDGQGEKSLALFPAKFQRSMWIKRGSFVVVDASGKEKVLESGSKVGCIVSQVLFYEQVRVLKKSPEWCVFSSHLKMMCHYLTICRRSLKHRLHKHVMFLCVLITRL